MTQNELLQYLPVGLPEDILSCKLHGDFARAVELIDQRLQSEALPRALRCCLMAEREMIVRLPSDYPLTPQQALAKIRSSVPDYTQQEWQQHLAAGQIRWIYVNGEMRIFDRFFESMCKSMPAFGRRAGVLLGGAESTRKGCKGDNRLSHAMEVMRREGSFSNRIRIRASVRIKDECFAPGFVRVHLPIPAACEQQSEIRIEKLYPENGQLSPENAPMRTVCWQEEMQTNHEFTVEYSYRHTARWHDAAEPEAPAEGALPPEAQAALAEQAPQICFTPYIRALTAELTENCATPLEKARRIYDFITLNCKYTYMPAYFSREEILSRGTAACWRCCLSHCAAVRAFRPSGKAVWWPSLILSAHTTGRVFTLQGAAGCMPMFPLASARFVPKTRSAAGFILAIWTHTAWWPTTPFMCPSPCPSSSGAPTPTTTSWGKWKPTPVACGMSSTPAARRFFRLKRRFNPL